MVVLQVYDNVTGRGAPARSPAAVPTVEPTAEPDQTTTQLAQLQSCVASDPSNLQCTSDLAALYYGLGQYPQAQVNYERAVRLSPHDDKLLLKLAGTYIFQQKFEQAAASLQQASSLKPDSPEIHLLLGLALSKLEPPRTAEAISEWQKVVSLAPGSKWATQATEYINEAGGH